MKKFLLAAGLMLATIAASAQLYVGGTVGLNRNTTDNVTEFTIAPEIGYNVSPKWAFATGLGYTYKYDSGFKSNVFQVNPYARYTYFRTDNNLVSLFLDGGVDLGFGKASYEDDHSKTVVLFGIGVKPGVSFNLTENFSLVAHFGFLGYYGGNHAAQDAGNPERFGFDFSSANLNLGFYYTY